MELNSSLNAADKDRRKYIKGLKILLKEFAVVEKKLLNRLKKESKSARRKLLKKKLRKVKLAYDNLLALTW